MIATLRGNITEVHATFFILEVCGVGYHVKASAPVLSIVRSGEERLLYVHDHVREDARDLYGFLSWSEQELFERLLNVSGVGPKVALTILCVGSVDMVRRGIMEGDLALLTSVPGVGKKTAQKIVLEMKGQLVDSEETAPGDVEAVDALVSLGYAAQEARQALQKISKDTTGAPARIREALKWLGK